MSVSDRLKYLLEDKGMNIKEFAIKIGLPYRTVQNYLRQENTISAVALTAIYTNLGININWLLTGEGEMYRSMVQPLDPSVLFVNARTGKPVTAADLRDMLATLKTQLLRSTAEVDFISDSLPK